MDKFRTKKHIVIAVVLICCVQLLLSLYWCGQKNYLFFDEVFSYAAANNEQSIFYEFEENQWMDESWYDSYMGAASEHRFEYGIPFRNQIRDVHPPLFYIFLHTACSIVPEEFSFMSGTSFNILFFIGCTIGLYFLGKELFGSPVYGLLAGLIYGVSFGGLNTVVFVRMYMLMTLFTVFHILVYLKYLEKEQVSVKGCLFLGLTLIGGVLSHYYFIFVAFCAAVWYTLKFIKNKNYKLLTAYLITMASATILALLIWPTMVSHLFSGGRGKEAQSNFLSLTGYLGDLKELFMVLNNDMFTKMLPVILAGFLGLFIICRKKGIGVLNRECLKKLLMVLFVSVGYFLLVAKIAPYKVDRYVMPIYPLVYAVVTGVAYALLSKLINEKMAGVLCVAGFVGLSAIHMVHSGIPYTYMKNPENIQRQELVEQYHDNYAIYISDNGECHHFYSAQILRNYKAFYHVYDLTTIEQTKDDLKVLQNEDQVLVYVSKNCSTEEVNAFLKDVFNENVIENIHHIDDDEMWNVYLIGL